MKISGGELSLVSQNWLNIKSIMTKKTWRYIVISVPILICLYFFVKIFIDYKAAEKILGDFTVVNKGLEKSNVYLKGLIAGYNYYYPYGNKGLYSLVDKCNRFSDSLYDYIELKKNKIIKESGGFEKNGNIKRQFNRNVPEKILIHSRAGDTIIIGLNKLFQYFDLIESEMGHFWEPPEIALGPKFSTKNNKIIVNECFQDKATISALSKLIKIQNEIRMTQIDIIKDVKRYQSYYWDSLVPCIQTFGNVLKTGEKFKVKIFFTGEFPNDCFISLDGGEFKNIERIMGYEVPAVKKGQNEVVMVVKFLNGRTGDCTYDTTRIGYSVY